MKTKFYLTLISLILCVPAFAQTEFSKYFENKTLRIDFALSGNINTQSAAIIQLREEPVWGGP